MPRIARITLFPIKALDGWEVQEARVLRNGALENDRRWAIVDGLGQFVHGKQTAAIHRIRARYGGKLSDVTLSAGGSESVFRLPDEASAAADWISDTLSKKCRLIENLAGGFPDDGDSPGPTIISTASLAAVASWFPGVDLDEMRCRIRANLEVDAAEAFWEDRIADDGQASPRFSIGDVKYLGRTICARCIVPTRDSQTGVGEAGFARVFAERRQGQLPAWSPTEQFDHFYRLAINTAADWVGPNAVVRIGDELVMA